MSVNLLAHIRDDRSASAATALWWLGQSGFIIKGAASTIVVDAFLTDYGAVGRRYAPPCAPHDVTDANLLVGTHDHLDHIDPEGFPAIAFASPQAAVVVPYPVVERVVALGIPLERVRGAEVDVPLELDGVRIMPIPAFHADSPEQGYGFHRDEHGRYPFLGYAVEVDGIRICHLGDTLIYDGLGERLRLLELDVLVLPINGRSWYREQRGIVGNMNVFEAAELAAESRASCVVPVHWDLFDDNTEDPMHFESYVRARHPSVNVEIPAIGAAIPVGAKR